MKPNDAANEHPESPDYQERTRTEKTPWQDPRLTFVEPTLTKHGDVVDLTTADGFFGTFTP